MTFDTFFKARPPWIILLPAVLAGLCVGCAVVRVSTPHWTLTAGSLFKSIEVPAVTVATNGTLSMTGYRGGVDGQALGTAAQIMLKP